MMSEYVRVYVYLLILLVLMVSSASVELGPLNPIIMMSIAVAKAVLIVLFFMHARKAGKAAVTYIVGGFIWVLILIGFTLTDFIGRLHAF